MEVRKMTDSQKRHTSNLLALRDGELLDSAEADLNSPMDQRKLEQLQAIKHSLNELPDIDPGEALLAKILARTDVEKDQNVVNFPVAKPAHAPFAMAAGLLLAVVIAIVAWTPDRQDPPAELAGFYGTPGNLAQLHARSRQLEPLVQNAGLANRDPSSRALLFRIADVDAQLAALLSSGSGPEQSHQELELQNLWGRRVALLESLAEVRRNRAALQPTVF
jgi:hypothetical protein